MSIGFIARKSKVLSSGDTTALTTVLLNVTLPALLIMSMQMDFDRTVFFNSLFVLVTAIGVKIACLFAVIPIVKLLKADRSEGKVLRCSMAFSNTTFMGIPIIYAVFGSDALMYAAMGSVAANVSLFTAGAAVMRGNRAQLNIKTILLNKLIIAIFIGFVLYVFSIRIPHVLGTGLSMIGGATTPLSMIVIGSILAENELKSVFLGWKMYIAIFMRLIVLPLVVFFLLSLFVADEKIVSIITILIAMPVAAVVAILAAQYENEPLLASRIVFVSTVLSVISIPLIISVISII